jgi:hypothetical protein
LLEVANRMNRPLSLTPSLSHALDELRGETRAQERPAPLARLRFTTDILGTVIFFLMLGTYLVARL